ncbi:NADPH-dependent FMN reductase [Cellulophaga sp. L1A9]|uniref:NADPH-dependent FMN reductase n=1 Tax=Cellulophaga sp. L1A9 TaxID=2686362 RepID=UPI00131A7D22|nr:NADPH-dependent FMN reductase [Cellulophaga sp. L1A9]
MTKKKNIIGICGSASPSSANLSILNWIANAEKANFNLELVEDLTQLPHFNTALTDENVPEQIVAFRAKIAHADGIIICTPEYIFSIPSGLKNMIEWCVSTTVFIDKPVGLITASASGLKGHAELKLIMETIQTKFIDQTTLLIQGVKGKVSKDGKIMDKQTEEELNLFIDAFEKWTQKLSFENRFKS